MRYGKPSMREGWRSSSPKGCDRVLVIPMYPQYAGSTTASVEDAVAAAMRKWKPAPELRVLRDFHAHRAYAKAIAKNINDYWFKHGRPDRLMLCFHGIPKRSVERGDPYQQQCLASAKLIAEELGWNDARTLTTFQSRFGAAEWLQPYTDAYAACARQARRRTRRRHLSRLRGRLPGGRSRRSPSKASTPSWRRGARNSITYPPRTTPPPG
jgi:ferrochelatase